MVAVVDKQIGLLKARDSCYSGITMKADCVSGVVLVYEVARWVCDT